MPSNKNAQTAFSIRFNKSAHLFPMELFKVRCALEANFTKHKDFYDGNDFTTNGNPMKDEEVGLSYGSLFYAFPKKQRRHYIKEVSRILDFYGIEFFVGTSVPHWEEAPLEGKINTDLLWKWVLKI